MTTHVARILVLPGALARGAVTASVQMSVTLVGSDGGKVIKRLFVSREGA